MFFDFTSDTVLKQNEWCIVWDIEVRIFSLLMEHHDELRALSCVQLAAAIRDDFINEPPHDSNQVKVAKFLHEFLAKECYYIWQYLQRPWEANSKVINSESIAACLEKSFQFRRHVEKRSASFENNGDGGP